MFQDLEEDKVIKKLLLALLIASPLTFFASCCESTIEPDPDGIIIQPAEGTGLQRFIGQRSGDIVWIGRTAFETLTETKHDKTPAQWMAFIKVSTRTNPTERFQRASVLDTNKLPDARIQITNYSVYIDPALRARHANPLSQAPSNLSDVSLDHRVTFDDLRSA